MKSYNIDPYDIAAIHRPHSELPGDFVSEGIGYGMFMALYSNDQEYFNKIWDAGEEYMYRYHSYDWRREEDGSRLGSGPATDAEEDIACMLLFADKLVEKGIWKEHKSPLDVTYKERALDVISVMYKYVGPEKNIMPGAWGEKQSNIGYFAPAFYRIFAEYDTSGRIDWDEVIDANYSIIENNPGYDLGLVPDWSDAKGGLLSDGPGYNAYKDGQAMYKDAIRVYWRLAVDYLWFKEPRAKAFLDNAYAFIMSKGGAKAANFYTLNGELVPADDVWEDMNGGETYRSRREHSQLTVGMWACVAYISGDEASKKEFSDELLSFYNKDDGYWGNKTSTENYGVDIESPDGTMFTEDIHHNERYFDQFLAWFGAAVISGNWVNVLEELK